MVFVLIQEGLKLLLVHGREFPLVLLQLLLHLLLVLLLPFLKLSFVSLEPWHLALVFVVQVLLKSGLLL